MMFQDPVGSLSPRMTVGAALAEPFEIHGRNVATVDEVVRLLDLVGLPPEFAERYPHQLSGGQARRIGVARALALEPALLIADEPTAGLDVSIQGDVLNLLSGLQERLGLGILIITHNLNIVRHVADHMAIMYLGRFVEQGSSEDIFRHPRHPYTKALLSANPNPDPDAETERLDLVGEVPSTRAVRSPRRNVPRWFRRKDRLAQGMHFGVTFRCRTTDLVNQRSRGAAPRIGKRACKIVFTHRTALWWKAARLPVSQDA
jgi:oligopeptide/dipeptide ABC transporter ATP-binding protein